MAVVCVLLQHVKNCYGEDFSARVYGTIEAARVAMKVEWEEKRAYWKAWESELTYLGENEAFVDGGDECTWWKIDVQAIL